MYTIPINRPDLAVRISRSDLLDGSESVVNLAFSRLWLLFEHGSIANMAAQRVSCVSIMQLGVVRDQTNAPFHLSKITMHHPHLQPNNLDRAILQVIGSPIRVQRLSNCVGVWHSQGPYVFCLPHLFI